MDNIRDLDLLIATHQPIIAIESPEEERVRSILVDLALRQDLPLFEWTSTRGLLRLGTHDPLYETEKPLAALRAAAGMVTEALYLFHDLDKYFDDPAVLRQIREIGEAFAADRRALILCSPSIEVPADLHAATVRVRLELPGLTELKQMAVRTLRDLGAPQDDPR